MKVLFVTHNGTSHEPLGLEYCSASLLRAGHQTKACQEKNTMSVVSTWKPDFVAFQVLTGDQDRWGAVARAVKDKYPHIKTIFGGPHYLFFSKVKQLEADYIIRGDGEESILKIIEGDNYVDFLPIETSDFRPHPDRALLYNDEFPGVRDNVIRNFISTFGCLGYNTPILLASGIEIPIQEIQIGDAVLSYDVESGKLIKREVQNTYSRVAEDLYEIEMQNGTKINITGEHPAWTPTGWKKIEKFKEGDLILATSAKNRADVPIVQEAISSGSEAFMGKSKEMPKRWPSEARNFLFEILQKGIFSKNELCCMQKRIFSVFGRYSKNLFYGLFFKIEKRTIHQAHDTRIERKNENFNEATQPHGRPNKQKESQFKQDGNAESYETSRSGGESLSGYETKTRKTVLGFIETKTQGWKNSISWPGFESQTCGINPNEIKQPDVQFRNSTQIAGGYETCLQGGQSISTIKELFKQARASIKKTILKPSCKNKTLWDEEILDRTMQVGYEKKSRFCSNGTEESNPFQREILAHGKEYKNSNGRLHFEEMERAEFVGGVFTQTEQEANDSIDERFSSRWLKIKKITFLGKSLVFNLTICPTHTYIASGLVLHNCPYKCSYCFNSNENWQEMVKGKNRLRYHSPEWIIEDIERTFKDYGGQFVSFQDDIFGIDLEWLEKFTRLYQRVRIPFFAQLRPRLITEDRIKLLKEAGIHIVSFAIESGNEQTRREFLDREEPNAIIEAGCKLLHKYKIKFRMQNMLGIPVDDPLGDALETLRFNMKMKPTLSWVSLLQAYPGTAIAKKVVAMGMFKSEEDLMPLVNSTFFDEGSLPIKGKKKIERLQKYWSAVVRWPWLYWPVRFLININFGKKFQNWIFETTKGYVNKKEYWRIEHMEKHVAITSHQELDRLGGELVRNKQKEAAVC